MPTGAYDIIRTFYPFNTFIHLYLGLLRSPWTCMPWLFAYNSPPPLSTQAKPKTNSAVNKTLNTESIPGSTEAKNKQLKSSSSQHTAKIFNEIDAQPLKPTRKTGEHSDEMREVFDSPGDEAKKMDKLEDELSDNSDLYFVLERSAGSENNTSSSDSETDSDNEVEMICWCQTG